MIKLVPHRITLSQLLNQQIFPGKAIYVLMDQDPGKFGTFMKYIQGVFFNWDPLKVLNIRSHSKSHQKSSKCQNLLTSWHLELLGGSH